jgi:hypothetical protein
MLSHVASLIRGSVGGLTYTANQFHAIVIRARVSPVQPGTIYQNMLRSAAIYAEIVWKALTANQKRAWELFADTVSFTGPAGSYTVPGRTLFFGWIADRYYHFLRGAPFEQMVNTSPTTPGRLAQPTFLLIAPPAVGVGFQVAFTNPSAIENVMFLVRSRGFNNGRNFWKGPWVSETLQYFPAPPASSTTFEFSDLVLGQVYFVKVYQIQRAGEAQVSNFTIYRTTAVAGIGDVNASDGGPGVSGAGPLTSVKRRKAV